VARILSAFDMALMIYNYSGMLYNPRFVIQDMKVHALFMIDGQGMVYPRRFN